MDIRLPPRGCAEGSSLRCARSDEEADRPQSDLHKGPPVDTPPACWGEESGDSPKANNAVSME